MVQNQTATTMKPTARPPSEPQPKVGPKYYVRPQVEHIIDDHAGTGFACALSFLMWCSIFYILIDHHLTFVAFHRIVLDEPAPAPSLTREEEHRLLRIYKDVLKGKLSSEAGDVAGSGAAVAGRGSDHGDGKNGGETAAQDTAEVKQPPPSGQPGEVVVEEDDAARAARAKAERAAAKAAKLEARRGLTLLQTKDALAAFGLTLDEQQANTARLKPRRFRSSFFCITYSRAQPFKPTTCGVNSPFCSVLLRF